MCFERIIVGGRRDWRDIEEIRSLRLFLVELDEPRAKAMALHASNHRRPGQSSSSCVPAGGVTRARPHTHAPAVVIRPERRLKQHPGAKSHGLTSAAARARSSLVLRRSSASPPPRSFATLSRASAARACAPACPAALATRSHLSSVGASRVARS